jgi:hypothetical protein
MQLFSGYNKPNKADRPLGLVWDAPDISRTGPVWCNHWDYYRNTSDPGGRHVTPTTTTTAWKVSKSNPTSPASDLNPTRPGRPRARLTLGCSVDNTVGPRVTTTQTVDCSRCCKKVSNWKINLRRLWAIDSRPTSGILETC